MDFVTKILTNRRGWAGLVTGAMAALSFSGFDPGVDESSLQAGLAGVLDSVGALMASVLAFWSLFKPKG